MAKEFLEEDHSKSKFTMGIWRKVFSHLEEDKKYVFFAVLVAVALASVSVGIPVYIGWLIDEFTDAIEVGNTISVYPYIGGLLGLSFIFAFSVFLFVRICGKINIRLAYRLRKKAFQKLQVLPFEFYDKRPIGWLMARMTSDAAKLSHALSWALIDLFEGLFVLIVVVIVMFWLNPQIALYALATLPFILLASYYFRKIILSNQRRIRSINSRITGAYAEGISGSVTTKTLSREEDNVKEFTTLTSSFRKTAIISSYINSLYRTFIILMFGIALATVYYVMGNSALEGVTTAGEIVIFISLVNKFFEPIQQMSAIMVEFQEGQASAERIIGLIDEEPSIKDTDEVIEKYGTIFDYKEENFEKLHGEVEFKDINFNYSTGEKILENFNLKIKKGTSVALVGETGSGKSTIVNLLCRFYEPTDGEVLIDGVDYRERSQSWLHSNLGYVLQTPQLFSGNIMENIRYGKLDATEEEVIQAAKFVGADEFIQKLEHKYETEVGEGGGRLSVGEKQLISFARAIIKDPAILILDEATSSIDTETEEILQIAIDKLLKDRTSFSIAHRLSTIVKADLILVLRKGEITEMGNHDELLEKKGYYYNLYSSQFEEDEVKKIME